VTLLKLLEGGDRRRIGRADEVVAMLSRDPGRFRELVAGLWSEDPVVRMRAADATEKFTRGNLDVLKPYKKELLGLMAETREQEMRWHLAAMIPRLSLAAKERKMVVSLLNLYLEDPSSIVKTSALQGLAELAQKDSSLRPQVIDLLREATRSGTPAMKARSRKLLLQLEGQ